MSHDESIRVSKYLAMHAGYSRRQADQLIEQSRVTVNNEPVVLGGRVSASDEVRVDGQLISTIDKPTYLAFHKPIGYVCSRRDQGDAPTIYNILPSDVHSLKTVGRLDKNSSGLILLTNDGDFTHKMTHPSFSKQKSYTVKIDQALQPLHRQMISDFGVMLEDGKSKFELERLEDSSDTDWRIVMSEGRNRQIRRTFSALGYTVIKLHRTDFGPYSLAGLRPGETRVIEP